MALFSLTRDLSPVDALARLQHEVERVFERPGWGLDGGLSGRGGYPPVNVFGDGDGLVLRIEVPGFTAENLDIEARGRTLSIRGKREAQLPANASEHRRERWSGEFSRSFSLPEAVDTEKVEATYRAGVLTVRLPKAESHKPRAIRVVAK